MKKNIMLIIYYLKNGGAERSIVNLANNLSKKHNVVIVVAKKEQDYYCSVPIYEINEFQFKSIFKKLKGIRKLKKLKKELKINTAISYTTVANFYNVVSKNKEKTIISIRNHLSTKKEGLIATICHKLSTFLSDLIICCSKSVKLDQIKKYHVKEYKLKVITNFCDINYLSELKKAEKTLENVPKEDYFITIARLEIHKGHEHIIKAMSLLIKKYPDIKLLIFGRGKRLEYLKQLVKKYNLYKNIIFKGFNPNPYQFLYGAKGFILASDYEGFSNAVIEAMACGTPIIATDCPGGNKETLTDYDFYDNNPITKLAKEKYGILIPKFNLEHGKKNITKNEEYLEEAMEFLLLEGNYQHYHKQSLQRIKKYTNEKVIKEWLEII